MILLFQQMKLSKRLLNIGSESLLEIFGSLINFLKKIDEGENCENPDLIKLILENCVDLHQAYFNAPEGKI